MRRSGRSSTGRVAVEVEEASLDLLHDRGARLALQLLAQDDVVGVEVAEVVGRDGAELVEQAARQLDVVGELVAVLGEQARQHVLTVEQHAAYPGEVVEPDLVDDDAARLDPEPAREAALEADRDVAEADGAVAAVEQGRG